MKDKDYKKEMIDKICSDLQKRAQEIHEDSSVNVEDQLVQMDVIWNIFKFLDHYSENIKVLEEYRQKKKERKRFMQGRDINE